MFDVNFIGLSISSQANYSTAMTYIEFREKLLLNVIYRCDKVKKTVSMFIGKAGHSKMVGLSCQLIYLFFIYILPACVVGVNPAIVSIKRLILLAQSDLYY